MFIELKHQHRTVIPGKGEMNAEPEDHLGFLPEGGFCAAWAEGEGIRSLAALLS